MIHQFVYVEDVQGYWHNHVLMTSWIRPVDAKALEQLSWKPPEAGRFSTSAETLVRIGRKHGWVLFARERREQSEEVPHDWAHLPVVIGATGNY